MHNESFVTLSVKGVEGVRGGLIKTGLRLYSGTGVLHPGFEV